MFTEKDELMFFELARLASLDIRKIVLPVEVRRYFAISALKLGDPTSAFERFSTEDVADIVATIIKEAPSLS